ncbi:hypothetical protein HDU76_011330 [Blyttiomyces sp. JEL0837]|nr:hypothetical protein HDU76_011330 [Blyttiomyces sp. JEL0837]
MVAASSSITIGSRYSVISTHVPTQSDELYIIVGDVVVIKEVFDDGWVIAVKEKSKQEGLIPSNFIIPYVEDAASKASSEPVMKRTASLSYKNKSPTATTVPSVVPAASTTPRSMMTESERHEDAKNKLKAVNAGREGRAKVASNIGSLKVVVVGDSGIGKTSLIKNFFESAEIVESDPIPPSDGIPAIKELRASTIPSAELHTGEEPYNLTFVDTPGFGSFMDATMIVKPVIDYHIQQFLKTDKVFVKSNAVPNLVKFLNAGTGCHTHVDAVLYCILHRLKPVDIEFMRQLSGHVSVIPVVVKSDTLKPSEVFNLKIAILEELSKANIPIYGFGLSTEELIDLAKSETPGGAPFVVSNPGAAPEGSQVGTVNEFEVLKRYLFFNHIDDLRQLSAERFVAWRTRNAATPQFR